MLLTLCKYLMNERVNKRSNGSVSHTFCLWTIFVSQIKKMVKEIVVCFVVGHWHWESKVSIWAQIQRYQKNDPTSFSFFHLPRDSHLAEMCLMRGLGSKVSLKMKITSNQNCPWNSLREIPCQMKTDILFLSHFSLCHLNTWLFLRSNTSEAASLNFGAMNMYILSKRLHSGWSVGMETNLGRIDSFLMSYAHSGAHAF